MEDPQDLRVRVQFPEEGHVLGGYAQEPAKPKPLTPQEKDRPALEHAVELAKRYVSAIVKLVEAAMVE